ncbi:unnamed protein product [Nesidiocoris tenuis]|uniref:RRM domain-containing protein n=1 Tax=Nesidiocoris tenuis TaxID=355587 RepID=A0A6H5GFB6_9HEMI|nr:unnamed protein product [Nesidiocoris tenuis]
MSDESSPTTLYVGNLDHSVSEELLCALFSQIGDVKGCKVIREPGNDPYAFEMKVNWATSPGNQPKLDTSNHYHIFVGDLSPEIETQTLRDAFAPFGDISNCRIVRDPQTLKSKGYAFVSFWLGNRSIRTNWSTRKPPPPRDNRSRQNNSKQPTYDEVFNQASPTNCTVYCGGFTNGISDELMHNVFTPFGTIQDIRCFKDKGYAFIKFTTKEAATRAIESVHNTEINGQIVKCFWGKETADPSNNAANAANANQVGQGAQWPYMYGNMGYWYQAGYNPTAAAAAAVGHMQNQGYLGGAAVQGYPAAYGQFGGYQQNYMGRVGMSWPGMGSAPNANSAAAANGQQMGGPPQGMAAPNNLMSTYAMGQFQTQ